MAITENEFANADPDPGDHGVLVKPKFVAVERVFFESNFNSLEI